MDGGVVFRGSVARVGFFKGLCRVVLFLEKIVVLVGVLVFES